MGLKIGIDVGGTFTDLLLFNDDSGEIQLLKTPSTPDDQSIGILILKVWADKQVKWFVDKTLDRYRFQLHQAIP